MDQDYLLFIEKVKSLASIDLSLYKEAQMKRRLTSFRDKKGYSTFFELFKAMAKDRALLDEFLDRMTINVSEFWRNFRRWEILRDVFIPELLRRNGKLRCWSAACSTGEEPYTLAMILHEKGVLHSSSILATDLDENVLEAAKKGIYHERSVREVPASYIQTYLRKMPDGRWEVSDELRRSVRFLKHNLLADRFETGYDLIICRNVTIYFTDEAKNRLYHQFSNSLRPGGILFVGSTEQIFSPGRYGLETADNFFYRRV
jgi:chemotaxis protein methyltransferase CheR